MTRVLEKFRKKDNPILIFVFNTESRIIDRAYDPILVEVVKH